MVLGAGVPPTGGFQLPGRMGSRPAPAEEEEQQVSRFESATERAGLQTPAEVDLESLLTNAGADITEPAVQPGSAPCPMSWSPTC